MTTEINYDILKHIFQQKNVCHIILKGGGQMFKHIFTYRAIKLIGNEPLPAKIILRKSDQCRDFRKLIEYCV